MSEDKIIDRRNRLIEMAKVEAQPYTPFYYILEENIDDINYLLYEKKKLELRFNKIKKYLKQVHIEQQNGILSSNNLIWENITRLCDGLEILEDRNE